ncbi:restriction endonuclease subunit S [Devosia sp. LjRoot3]|uniref:restriction endonuclease subunit S n=1 Tax=Devosia sp. LjRoot3 TaxID=3342319 RepID=UPI003ED16848
MSAFLGSLPYGWKYTKLKRVVQSARPVTYGIVQAGPMIDGGVPYIRPADMTDEKGVADINSVLRTSTEIAAAYRRSTIQTNDLVCSIGPSFGKVMVVPEELSGANLTQGTARIAIEASHSARFYFWVLRSTDSYAQWESSVGGATFRALNLAPLAETTVPEPPLAEQVAIAAFLDRETGKIDALVEEQRRLIELLKEKRQAVISHAVIKGLDPDARMKPSGLEWLGDVPEHWVVTPIRMVARLESGHTPSRSRPEWWEDCTVPWFSLADIWQVRKEGRTVITETSEQVSEIGLANSSARVLPAGTVMLSRTASVGFAAIMGVDMATTQDFANWVCGPKLNNHFLLWTFRAMRPEFSRLMMGSTHNTIYMPDLAAFRMPLPPMNEQLEVVAFLQSATGKIDRLLDQATAATALLSERRAALISAAVTGKIDVRQVNLGEVAA